MRECVQYLIKRIIYYWIYWNYKTPINIDVHIVHLWKISRYHQYRSIYKFLNYLKSFSQKTCYYVDLMISSILLWPTLSYMAHRNNFQNIASLSLLLWDNITTIINTILIFLNVICQKSEWADIKVVCIYVQEGKNKAKQNNYMIIETAVKSEFRRRLLYNNLLLLFH